MTEELVLTPGGLRPKSAVHLIEPKQFLRVTKSSLQKRSSSEEVLEEFETIPPSSSKEPVMPRNTYFPPKRVPSLGSGWITYAYWNNNTGTPISLFKTTWVVPPPPSTQSSQTIFLFNGIQNSTMIYQPVLQWGTSAAGGGNYWSVASWYADGQGGQAFHSPLVRVNPGDTLVGVMTLTGQTGTSFNYNCIFQGIANTNLDIQNVQELTWSAETLEAYGITQCSDYPNTSDTAMKAIFMQTGSVNPTLSWTTVNSITDCGQFAVVVSNSATAGEVDLHYNPTGTYNGRVPGLYVGYPSADGWLYLVGTGPSGASSKWTKIKPNSIDFVTDVLVVATASSHAGTNVTAIVDSSGDINELYG